MKRIISIIIMAISCTLLLLPCCSIAFASEESTEESSINADLEKSFYDRLGFEHAPPSWWDEDQALEMAIEQVKQIQVDGEYINADWDGEYEFYTLALGNSDKNYDEDSYYFAYFTFYKEDPIFYLESNSSNYILCDAYYGINLKIEDNGSGGMNICSTSGSKNQPYDYVNSSNKGHRIFEVEEDEESGEKIVSYYHPIYGTYHCYSKSNLESSIWENLGLKAPEIVGYDGSLSVSFTPSLSGEVDRSTMQNGVATLADLWMFTITNNSDSNYQFMMQIVKEGTIPSFGTCVANPSGVPTAYTNVFTFICPEWHGVNGEASVVYSNFAWHKVSAGSAYTRAFSWEQLNLQKEYNYTIYIFGIPISGDYPHLGYISDYNIDYIYSSTFSIKNPAIYNPQNDSFNNIANDTGADLNALCQPVAGYINDQGETILGDYFMSNDGYFDIADYESSGNKFNQSNIEYGINSLGSLSASYFNLLRNAFNIFPAWFWSIICLSIFSIVVVALIKNII